MLGIGKHAINAVDEVVYTQLLAHFNDLSMPPTDECGGTYTIAYADQNTTIVDPKFGTRCLDNGHTGAYSSGGGGHFTLTQPIPDGATSWCIETWVKISQAMQGGTGFAFGLSGPNPLAGVLAGIVSGEFYAAFKNGAAPLYGPTITTDAWHHLAAYVRNSEMYMAVDGVVTAGGPITTDYLHQITEVDVGYDRISLDRWPGQIDELRVTVPSPYGADNFTPPTAPFTLE